VLKLKLNGLLSGLENITCAEQHQYICLNLEQLNTLDSSWEKRVRIDHTEEYHTSA
jgi:hypothetical protein